MKKSSWNMVRLLSVVIVSFGMMGLFIPSKPLEASGCGTWTVNYDAASPHDSINAMAVYQGKVYAGSGPEAAIYEYDGVSWSLNTVLTPGVSQVHKMAVFDNKLYVGTSDGGFGRIFVYDGVTWSVSQGPTPGVQKYFSLAEYDGKLYAGTGDSGQIFVFDGVSWSDMGVAFGGTFYDLLAYNGKLYTVYDTVYAYDGVSWAVAQPSIGAISLAVYDNKLFVGTANTGLVHQFDGTTWSSVWVTSEPILTELEVHDGKLYLGTNPGGHIYAFDGSSWLLCFDSPEETVGALASFNGMLFAGTSSSGLIYLMGGTASSSVDLYLHASGSTLFLDNLSPGGSTAKFRDSSSLNFNSGNPWKEIGTWGSIAGSIPPPATTLTELGDLKVWLGLKNSDDQGTRFDLRAEVYKNGVLIAAGEMLCITGVTRNPALAREVIVDFGTIASVSITSADVISVKILARIGTDGAGGLCGGHSNAVGVRMYFDSVSRPANLKATFETGA